jgi:hypothetical protein
MYHIYPIGRSGIRHTVKRDSFGYLYSDTNNDQVKESAKTRAYNYISNMNIDELTALNKENQNFIDLEKLASTEKARYEFEMHKIDEKIQNLENSLKNEYPPMLEQLARNQLKEATDKLAFLGVTLTSIIDKSNDTLNHIRSEYVWYDFTLATRMSDHIVHTLNDKRLKQEKNAHQEKLLLKKKTIEDNQRLELKKKRDYAIRAIDFLSQRFENDGSVFVPRMEKMIQECYLNELIEKAHLKHYQEICDHEIDFDKPYDDYYFINPFRINSNHSKRYAPAVSVDILKFKNRDHFDLDNRECSCIENQRID